MLERSFIPSPLSKRKSFYAAKHSFWNAVVALITLVGSLFLVGGPTPRVQAQNVVTLSVNGTILGTVQPDVNRQFTVTLSSPAATAGTYIVTADMGVHTSTTLRIAVDALLHTPVGEATFALPVGIAYPNEEYLPVIAQN